MPRRQKENKALISKTYVSGIILAINRGEGSMAKKYLLNVYGCQMNERDAEIIAGYLEKLGYRETSRIEEADFIALNTCAVRQKAEEKVYGKLGKLKKLKEQKPELMLAVAGCMAQQPGVAEKIKSRFPFVDLIIGTHNLHEFPRLVEEAAFSRETVLDVWEQAGSIQEFPQGKRKHPVKAWVSISYGCDNYCSYCIVPYVRGRERSRKQENIINEVKGLVGSGYKEITLLGQNVNSYGKDLGLPDSFPELLLSLEKIAGLERVRYMTSHPRDFSANLIEVLRIARKVCEHVHLPVQAGSDRILKAMNRGYTGRDYLDLVKRIRAAVPGVSLTTDIIVGFPGESEEDFQQTLDLIEAVRFDAAYTFKYSPRRGTPAALLTDQVADPIKRERLAMLLEKQNLISREINEKLVGKSLEVLVEGKNDKYGGKLFGRTRTNKIVNFSGEDALIGSMINVKITEAQTWSLTGEIE
ncbi:MAG TPA: tRNA (N6-isopentenyl adenosine(37)-C2)-methylthiotransferase MiaB [Firmicutes bacterium]|nr:tRNA (N6-isopentenyl adenosine(37)-C2)-methylthiotransferase MiaB [Bacillota bacterium]